MTNEQTKILEEARKLRDYLERSGYEPRITDPVVETLNALLDLQDEPKE